LKAGNNIIRKVIEEPCKIRILKKKILYSLKI
jgi:hypothetical protein